MSLNEDKFSDKYKQYSTNPFRATQILYEKARQICKETHNVVSPSEALTLVIRGEEPDILSRSFRMKGDQSIPANILDTELEYVTKDEIREAVEDSIYDSLKIRHLIYRYKGLLDESEKARVRVLTNIIWAKYYKV